MDFWKTQETRIIWIIADYEVMSEVTEFHKPETLTIFNFVKCGKV